MARAIASLAEVADGFGAVVLDQWGVLHDGRTPYPGAVDALRALAARGTRLAVLSNSGKRAGPNADRIAAMGFPNGLFETVMTSGEALWRDIAQGRVTAHRLFPIERAPGDARAFCEGLPVTLAPDLAGADAVLLMGLPDDADPAPVASLLDAATARGLTVHCTNPDRASPRADGATVVSPGALAHDLARRGGTVRFYGKPHPPVFEAVAAALDLPPARLLMVGDSPEHDIAGAAAAGWSSVFVRGGLHRAALGRAVDPRVLHRLFAEQRAPLPDFILDTIGARHA
ncbi:TIGR01459 family HAD-type hydrolase [Palleronia sediminis]|uniref:TIGR01459 family HAD-type hydrolase n=1 Tax=Palleronia sediminis TaxID=2547833 RepID=A0A4R6AEG2_9RHOB|nr:TIGR01459 family HAD-type hydrolase [Palleronia sediminis]TDL79633.1 TIGR01459 family HAD-type hydrolase [Palleronia sediminis]